MESHCKMGCREEHSRSTVYPTSNYDKNSSLQKSANDTAKCFIHDAISKNMEVEKFSQTTFGIADLGCSVGPNTILVMEEIIEAVEKYNYSMNIVFPEFQVFFNDINTNDFNTLFQYLPINKKYYACGVPGSFHGRLFPTASIHFVHSSFALQWLSRVPNEVRDEGSSSWNKGNVYYSHARDEVAEAYARQFELDFNCFLDARAQEVVHGGLIVIIIPGRLNGVHHSQVSFNMNYHFLGLCLHDLFEKGLVDEEQIDSFNIPIYHPSPEEMEKIVHRNGYFNLERKESLPWKPTSETQLPPCVLISNCVRAVMEGTIGAHFGYQIIDQLFDLYTKKLQQEYATIAISDVHLAFVLLKRNGIKLLGS